MQTWEPLARPVLRQPARQVSLFWRQIIGGARQKLVGAPKHRSNGRADAASTVTETARQPTDRPTDWLRHQSVGRSVGVSLFVTSPLEVLCRRRLCGPTDSLQWIDFRVPFGQVNEVLCRRRLCGPTDATDSLQWIDFRVPFGQVNVHRGPLTIIPELRGGGHCYHLRWCHP